MSVEQVREERDNLLDEHITTIDRDFGTELIEWLDTEEGHDLSLLIADVENSVTRAYNEGSVAELKAALREHRELHKEAERMMKGFGD